MNWLIAFVLGYIVASVVALIFIVLFWESDKR